jgi:hypothetical protein
MIVYYHGKEGDIRVLKKSIIWIKCKLSYMETILLACYGIINDNKPRHMLMYNLTG